jgi:FkbM family methyltransferase
MFGLELRLIVDPQWGEGWCRFSALLENRTITIVFPPHEKMIVMEALAGESYHIHQNAYSFLTGLPVVDIGAHVGATAAYFSAHLNPREIHSYEPNPRAIEFLERNACSIPNLKVHPAAIGYRSGTATLNANPDALFLSSIAYKSEFHKEKFDVPVVIAKEALEEIEGPIGVLKIDVEAAEVSILEAAGNELSRVRVVYLEHHAENLRREADQILADNGFYLLHGHFSWTRGVSSYIHESVAERLSEETEIGRAMQKRYAHERERDPAAMLEPDNWSFHRPLSAAAMH